MNNAELIKALRCKTNDINDCTMCSYHNPCYGGTLEEIAADALEADERLLDLNTKRCEALRKQLRESHENYEKHLNELEAQMPKEGAWICSYPEIEPNPMFMYGICSKCGFEQSISDKLNYCPNCGARMKGEQE